MQKLFLYDFEIPMEAESLTLVFAARADEPYNERNWLYMPPLMLTGDAHIKKKKWPPCEVWAQANGQFALK